MIFSSCSCCSVTKNRTITCARIQFHSVYPKELSADRYSASKGNGKVNLIATENVYYKYNPDVYYLMETKFCKEKDRDTRTDATETRN